MHWTDNDNSEEKNKVANLIEWERLTLRDNYGAHACQEVYQCLKYYIGVSRCRSTLNIPFTTTSVTAGQSNSVAFR